ncbi:MULTISPECIES: type VII secretion target [Amycolatopsis]|uniref:type VII secretion target n=1 Tax=Amycolatopsis TaxID=1813 RepID=UPI000B8B31FD|nr:MULTISPECIES: type VII secretion target [Amycolatopsis]OXM63264.1 ESX-1 secretion-associated protein [Amycolatopsis sp. KNN50.9b]
MTSSFARGAAARAGGSASRGAANGYEVLTDELGTHAGKVDGLAQRLQTAVDAARQVSMDNSAFGVICQPFAMMLDPFEQMGIRALETAKESVTGTAGNVRTAVTKYEGQDEGTRQTVKQLGEPLT